MEITAKIIRKADKLLNFCIMTLIILAMLFGCFSLWDTYQIYSNAGIDSELLKYKPSTPSDSALSELIALNPDVRAWLTIDDTNIDYPLVQGKTNMDYLNTDVYGNYSLSGSIFVDCRNSQDFSDFYTLLYGHHMDGDVMFGGLDHFYENAYFETHTSGTLHTPNASYRLELFACVSADAYDNKVFNPTAQNKPSKRSAMLAYIAEKSLQYRDIGLSENDRIIGLSTCSDATTNGRTVVYARMTEITD